MPEAQENLKGPKARVCAHTYIHTHTIHEKVASERHSAGLISHAGCQMCQGGTNFFICNSSIPIAH